MLSRAHRFTDKVGVDMDLGVGGAAVKRHRRAWRRFGVGDRPGWVDLLDLHVQLGNKAQTPRWKQLHYRDTGKERKKDINRTLLAHLMKNGGCEDLVAAAPRQPQLVKQGPHLSGLCDLLRGFRLKILVYCFAFHPTINFGLVSLRPVLTKRGKYILGWNQDFKVVLSKLSSQGLPFRRLVGRCGRSWRRGWC